MFEKILIANRGEIAVRIIRTCKEMNIRTVAVYSEADANSMHVQLADEAICIGKAPVSDSYLRIDRIISAAEITDVDAIHPGYGLLSENAHFADVCENCNIKFIGPNSDAMNALEDKAVSRRLAQKAGFAEEDFDKVFIALDKLDKIGFDGVVGELVEEGLDEEKAKTVLNFALSISAEGLEKAKEVLKDVVDEKVFDNLAEIIAINSCDKFKLKFDCTLVRGMNYYTGPIFEIEVDGFGVSVAGGGRYDNMLGKFLNRSVPACGFSIGFERIFTVLKEKGVSFGEQPKKIAYVVDSRCGADIISKVFKEAEKIRSQGGICLVTKRIKNFGFLLEQLKKDGYSDIFQVNEKGEIRITD